MRTIALLSLALMSCVPRAPVALTVTGKEITDLDPLERMAKDLNCPTPIVRAIEADGYVEAGGCGRLAYYQADAAGRWVLTGPSTPADRVGMTRPVLTPDRARLDEVLLAHGITESLSVQCVITVRGVVENCRVKTPTISGEAIAQIIEVLQAASARPATYRGRNVAVDYMLKFRPPTSGARPAVP